MISNVKTKWEVNQKSWVNYSWHLLENNMIDVTTNIYKVISGNVIFSFVFLRDNIIKENKLVWRRWNQMRHNIKCFTHINLYRTLNLFSSYTKKKKKNTHHIDKKTMLDWQESCWYRDNKIFVLILTIPLFTS